MCEFCECLVSFSLSHSSRRFVFLFCSQLCSFFFTTVSECVFMCVCKCVRILMKYPNICYRMPKETLPHIPSWMNSTHVFVAAAATAAPSVCHTDVIARLLRIKMYSNTHRDTNKHTLTHTRHTSNDNDNNTQPFQLHGFECAFLFPCVRATVWLCAHTFGLSSTQLYTINIA